MISGARTIHDVTMNPIMITSSVNHDAK